MIWFENNFFKLQNCLIFLFQRQARRVYEILRLKITDESNPSMYRQYRLDLKRRLNIPFQVRHCCNFYYDAFIMKYVFFEFDNLIFYFIRFFPILLCKAKFVAHYFDPLLSCCWCCNSRVHEIKSFLCNKVYSKKKKKYIKKCH